MTMIITFPTNKQIYQHNVLHNILCLITVSVLNELTHPDSKDHGANKGSIWGRQGPGGPHVGPMNLAILDTTCNHSASYRSIGSSIAWHVIHQMWEHRLTKDFSAFIVYNSTSCRPLCEATFTTSPARYSQLICLFVKTRQRRFVITETIYAAE